MKQRRIWGGVKPSPNIYQRQAKQIVANGYVIDERDSHFYGDFHQAKPTRMPHISWAIIRIRRHRAGQLPLFGSKRAPKRTKTQCVPFWGWAIPAPKKRRKQL